MMAANGSLLINGTKGFERKSNRAVNAFINRMQYYIMAKYTVLIEQDEGGWFVSEVLELPGCHTQAKTLDELLSRTKEAIHAYLGNEPNIEHVELKLVGIQQIEA